MITLDLPVPPSVNRTRRVDWRGARELSGWKARADAPFEVLVVLSDRARLDGDNGLKALLDYLIRIEVIQDDGPKFMRRLVVEWGEAPEGVRVTVAPFDGI